MPISDGLRAYPQDPLDGLAERINDEHRIAAGFFEKHLDHAIKAGRLLLQAKATLAARHGSSHGRWLAWLAANCTVPARTATKYMRIARRADKIGDLSGLSLREVEKLCASPLEALYTSASPDWFTPPHIVALVEQALGAIDLDPCCHRARRCGPAEHSPPKTTASPKRGGMVALYLNPPYGHAIDAWIAKLVNEQNASEVEAAIALVPARTDTAWFARLDPYPRVFVAGRLTFSNAAHSAPFPSAVAYLGPEVRRFASAFADIGRTFVQP